MKKKFGFVSLLTVMILSFVAAGCGSTTTPAASTAATTTSSAAASDTPKDNGPTTEINLMYPGVPQKDVAAVEAEANKYLKDKLNLSIKINAVDFGQWTNKLNLMIASSENADIIFTAAWQQYSINVAKGAFIDLGPYIDGKLGADLKKELDPAFFAGSKIDGKNYGIPTNKELSAQRGLLVRKDLAAKYNIDLSAIKTWADWTPVFKTIKENEPNVTPWYISNSQNNGILAQLDWDYLGDETVPGVIRKIGTDTKVVNAVETPEYLAAAKLMREWNKAGYINKDAATSTVFPHDQAKTGKVFAWADGLKPGKDAEEESYTGQKLGQVEMTKPTISTNDTSGAMLAISKTSKNPEKAFQIIALLHSDPYFNNLINFGIEGKHYVKVAGKDGIIDAGPNAADYNPGANWELGNQFLNYLRSNEDPKKWEKFKAFNAAGTKSPALGFTFNSEPVKTEIAAVNNIAKQYDPSLTSGSVDPDVKIPEYLAKLKAAGIDKIITEKQAQLDKFLAANK
ncbi:MAG: sugar transporter substrate-binding protein [Bacilli bacterium]|nr:sugar transporter substrate-binding protein [Bacilli bacterium]